MRLTSVIHHIMPFAALAGGILVLLMPRLLNYIVAVRKAAGALAGPATGDCT